MKKKALVILVWLCIWQLFAMIVHNDILLVGPVETVRALAALFPEKEFRISLVASFIRIVGGFLAGSLLGMLSAFWAYRKPLFGAFLSPLVTMLKTVPVVSFVILVMIWAGSERLSFLISMMVVFPIMYLNTLHGFQSADRKLLEMAQVYHMPAWSRFRCIFFPAVYPFLLSGFRLALGMSWKSGVAAEVIGQPLHSIGNGLYRAKIYLATSEVLAWTIVIVILSWGFEKCFLRLFGFLDPSAGCGKKEAADDN